jgi:DNA recombination protein RmuC
MMDLVYAGIGLVVGVVLGIVIGRLTAKSRGDQSSVISELKEDKTELIKQRGELELQLRSAEGRIREAEARYEAEKNNLAEQRRLLEETEKKFREVFQALAKQALSDSSRDFLQLAEEKLKGRTEPLAKKLEEYRELSERIIKEYGSVDNQLKTLDQQTRQLVDALKRPQPRGRWGEVQLRRLVELAGMSPYCDFDEQITIFNESAGGKYSRPDMVINLPDDRVIVIDSKTSADHYLRASEAEGEKERNAELVAFAGNVKGRMRELAERGYHSCFNRTPEFVIQFMPNEAFFAAALEIDRELIEWGFENGVILASPTSLMALLLAVAQGWKEDRLKETVSQIAEEGRTLYDRLRVIAEHLAKLGSNLDSSVDSYNDFVNSVDHRLLPSARRLSELGAGTGKELPELGPVNVRTNRPRSPELTSGEGEEKV